MAFNVNILSMSTRAVTSVAYFSTRIRRKMIATKIQIVSDRMQNITTNDSMTDSCIDCENAQLKIYKMPIKSVQVSWISSLSRDVRKFVPRSSFHASILLSSLFITSDMLNSLKSIASYWMFKDFRVHRIFFITYVSHSILTHTLNVTVSLSVY